MKHLLLLFFTVSFFLKPTESYSQTGVSLDGFNKYVSFGNPAGLGNSQFTLEVWFKIEGTGVSVQTDIDGVKAFPLISKGRAEGEGNNLDMNYFLGIDSAINVLCADFEEGSGQPNPGKNHPLKGVTTLCYFQWYHAAVTFDGITMSLFLNGILESSIVLNVLPQSLSVQHAALGSTLSSSGTPSGYFRGRLDEARIWNYARTQSQINLNHTLEINSAPGLTGRWGMNEGTGTICFNTGTASGANGNLVNGTTWQNGSPFQSFLPQGNYGLALEGNNSYVGFGNNTLLGLNQFTLEAWFLKKPNGTPATSGSRGVVAIPIIAKGRGESDGNNRDMNYFLGIDTATGFLVADFEEAIGQRNPGRNHPITGATQIQNDIWYHAAVTYDGATWNLYLNGNLENQLFVGQLPQSLSIQHASIGSALNSVGTPEGFFSGILDEVRIWNFARSQSDIKSKMNLAITSVQNGLTARWGMNEACSFGISDSSGNSLHAYVMNANWYWTQGASFNLPVPLDPPGSTLPANQAGGVYLNSHLSVGVSDPEGKDLTVTYFIQPCPSPAASDFTVVGMPDTQHYVSYMFGGTNEMLKAQTTWITQNRISENIVFVQGLGDCVQNGDNGGDSVEWERFDTAMTIIENPVTTFLQDGIPYGLNVGNHDQTPIGDVSGTTNFFNSYFGESRFAGRNYYGGHYGTKNNNNYSFFSAGGHDFIVINLEYNLNNIDSSVARWLRDLLTIHSNRYAIIGSHYMLNGDGTFAPQGLAIYNVIKRFPNVILTQSGHVSAESRREDIYDGKRIISIMADYQSRSYGGSGWMRLLKFSPANNTISVRTYSPWLNQFETDSNSQFSYSFNMSPLSGYSVLGTNTNVPSGSIDSIPLSNLQPNTCYFWYVTVSNGTDTVKSETWQFQTYVACNEIDSFSPVSGTEGDTILIKGTKLNIVSQVTFNGTNATFNIINDSTIKVIVPAGAGNGRIILKGSCTDSSSTDFIVHNCSSFPNIYSVTGGGLYCAFPGTGSPVGLSSSQTGVNYQLFCNNTPVSSLLAGTGNSLTFGNQTQTGLYSVEATNAGLCSSVMSGQVSVNVAPVPNIGISVTSPILCYGGSAAISVQASGGTSPYVQTGNYSRPAGLHNFTITDANNCAATGQITLTQPSKVEVLISGVNASCGNSNGTATVFASGGTPGYTYQWSDGQTAQTAVSLTGGNYSVIVNDQNACSNTGSVSITNSGALPGAAGSITGPQGACRNSVITYSIAPLTGATSYAWVLPSGTTGSSSSNSITVTFLSTFNGGFICVTGQNNCGSGTSGCLNVPVLTIGPSPPSPITGPVNACPLNTYTYSVSPVLNASNYVWTVSGTGATLTQGQGTNSISVSIASGFSKGKISVYATNCKGNSDTRSLEILGIPVHSNALIGSSYICAGTNGHAYSISPVTGASSYTWFVVSGNLQIASQSGTSVVINAGSNFTTGVLAVAAFNSCGSYSKTYTIRSVPAQPGGISGTNNGLCGATGVQYSIASVSGASSYSWTVPQGVNIVSASGTTLIVNFTTGFSGSGNICVVANNFCGASIARCLQVKSTLSPPSVISGPESVCKTQSSVTYTIPPVTGATSYLWNISGGANITPLGNGTSASANFTWASSSQAFISVNCENSCGYGSGVTKTLTVNLSCRDHIKGDFSFPDFSIFPNPGTGLATLSFYSDQNSDFKFIIEDVIGKIWRDQTFEGSVGLNLHELDLTSLPRGIYFVSIQSENKRKELIRIVLN